MVQIVTSPTEMVPTDTLHHFDGNPNIGDVDAIADSIEANGFVGSLIVQRSTRAVLGGNHSLDAAVRLGLTEVPVQWVDCDDQRAKRILLALNRTRDFATYDDEALVALLRDLAEDDELGLDGSGFVPDDLDLLAAELDLAARGGGSDERDDDDPDPPVPTAPKTPTTKPGDLWMLGDHRILCGDCRRPDDVDRLLGDTRINVAFTSPPYASQREYDETSGFLPITPGEYVEWFRPVAANVAQHLADDGSWFVNIKPPAEGLDTDLYVFDLVIAHVREWGWHFATEYCWERNGIPGKPARRFKAQFEPIYQFARAEWKFRPDAMRHQSASVPVYDPTANLVFEREQGQPGMTSFADPRPRRANHSTATMHDMQGTGADIGAAVIEGLAYPGNRLPTFAGSHEATGHTAAFPVGLPAFFVRAYSDPGDTIFDPFMGSGSTLLAAHKEGRVGLGIEISPGYVDVICERFQRLSGELPVRDGVPFDFLASSPPD